jgi:hypothetical protein
MLAFVVGCGSDDEVATPGTEAAAALCRSVGSEHIGPAWNPDLVMSPGLPGGRSDDFTVIAGDPELLSELAYSCTSLSFEASESPQLTIRVMPPERFVIYEDPALGLTVDP